MSGWYIPYIGYMDNTHHTGTRTMTDLQWTKTRTAEIVDATYVVREIRHRVRQTAVYRMLDPQERTEWENTISHPAWLKGYNNTTVGYMVRAAEDLARDIFHLGLEYEADVHHRNNS